MTSAPPRFLSNVPKETLPLTEGMPAAQVGGGWWVGWLGLAGGWLAGWVWLGLAGWVWLAGWYLAGWVWNMGLGMEH